MPLPIRRPILDYALIIAETSLMALGISLFYAPNGLIAGGSSIWRLSLTTTLARWALSRRR